MKFRAEDLRSKHAPDMRPYQTVFFGEKKSVSEAVFGEISMATAVFGLEIKCFKKVRHFKCPKFRHFKWNGKFFLELGKAFYLSVRRYIYIYITI